MEKLLSLDDIVDRPIEEVIALYQNGYRIDTLQECGTGCTHEGLAIFLGILGILAGLLVASEACRYGQNAIREEIKEKCPGCLDKLKKL